MILLGSAGKKKRALANAVSKAGTFRRKMRDETAEVLAQKRLECPHYDWKGKAEVIKEKIDTWKFSTDFKSRLSTHMTRKIAANVTEAELGNYQLKRKIIEVVERSEEKTKEINKMLRKVKAKVVSSCEGIQETRAFFARQDGKQLQETDAQKKTRFKEDIYEILCPEGAQSNETSNLRLRF